MSIFQKSLLTLSAAALTLTALLVVSVLAFMNFLYYETNARLLRETAAAFLAANGEARTAEWLSENRDGGSNSAAPFLPAGSFRLTLIDRAGNVRFDSHVQGALVNHLDREEVRAALAGMEGRARRDSLSTGMRQLYAAFPVRDAGGAVAGVFRLSFAVPSFWRRIAPAALPFLCLAGIFGAGAFLAVFLFSRSLAASVNHLVHIAEDAGRGPWKSEGTEAPEAARTGAAEFIMLEKALRGMTAELTVRIERARAEGRRLEAILDGMAEAVFALDGKLSLVMVNPRARELFGLADGTGLPLLEAARSTELENAARNVLASGLPEETEITLHGAGTARRFQVFAAPLLSPAAEPRRADGSGEPEGIVMVLQDITRLVRLEQVRKDFVANVSHELRTPIQLVKGFSETLLDAPPEDAERLRHFMEIIRKNAVTMENLTNDLLILANLEDRNASRPDREEQEIAPLFAEAAAPAAFLAEQKQTEIVVDCPPLRARVYGSLVVQALINLLDNAIKYSPPASRVEAAARVEDGDLVITVRDRGIGIPAEHLERIFERFYRVDRAHSRAAGGTGLGLAIVHHIALLHNGTATAESHAGEGSVFTLRLPR
ncbi:MAG: PAS domain-containing protein [Spirochaetaceae bacterium]|jgi:two-component system phosphate regulon sensor histidine kinase PhoR|nr:PAS domain-containing protein [Spirochaetaceae bacterium]